MWPYFFSAKTLYLHYFQVKLNMKINLIKIISIMSAPYPPHPAAVDKLWRMGVLSQGSLPLFMEFPRTRSFKVPVSSRQCHAEKWELMANMAQSLFLHRKNKVTLFVAIIPNDHNELTRLQYYFNLLARPKAMLTAQGLPIRNICNGLSQWMKSLVSVMVKVGRALGKYLQ